MRPHITYNSQYSNMSKKQKQGFNILVRNGIIRNKDKSPKI